ncbi:MAG: tetratricopeptide repeat protein [Planctomycetota bacterium]
MSRDGASNQLTEHAEALTGGADLGAVVQLLLSECDTDGLARLLATGTGDIARAAAVCLGLQGSLRDCRALVSALRAEDPELVQTAENSLWLIWMRAGSAAGNQQLVTAIERIRDEDYLAALVVLDELSTCEPDFAEAHHQRGIVLFFLERLAAASTAFRQALRRNQYHYLAAVNLGHVYVERGNYKRALFHYRNALRIHPQLDEIPEVVQRLELVAHKRSE